MVITEGLGGRGWGCLRKQVLQFIILVQRKKVVTTNQILQLDCRIQSNADIIENVLRKIKPLSKSPEGQQVPLEKLERCIKVLCNKYNYFVPSIYPDLESGDKIIIWKCRITDRQTLNDIGITYGCTFYECIAKAVIFLYSRTRK